MTQDVNVAELLSDTSDRTYDKVDAHIFHLNDVAGIVKLAYQNRGSSRHDGEGRVFVSTLPMGIVATGDSQLVP
ncbi:MAG TPA: hypothetical protein VET88_09490 [Gammaproteobacteria bacterium]|nr:hypothetical protein [Gammaproteobacteria bacterium]